MTSPVKSEPVVTTAAVTSVLGALIAAFVAFGPDLSTEQTAAILGLAVVIVPLLNVAARFFVTPTGGGQHRA